MASRENKREPERRQIEEIIKHHTRPLSDLAGENGEENHPGSPQTKNRFWILSAKRIPDKCVCVRTSVHVVYVQFLCKPVMESDHDGLFEVCDGCTPFGVSVCLCVCVSVYICVST